MGYPSENIFVMQSAAFDIGNTAANVAAFVIPVQCSVVSVGVCPTTASGSNAFTVSFDSLTAKGVTQGAADVGNIVVTDAIAAVPYSVVYDVAGQGVNLDAGDSILVQVDEAGTSAKNALAVICLQYLPETYANDTANITETA